MKIQHLSAIAVYFCLTRLTVNDFPLVSNDNFSSSSLCLLCIVALPTALPRRAWHRVLHTISSDGWLVGWLSPACPCLSCTGKPEMERSTLDVSPQCWAEGKTPFPWPTGNPWPAQHAAGSCPPGPPDPILQSFCPASQSPVYIGGWGCFSLGAGLVSQCWMPWDSLRAASTETSINKMPSSISRAFLLLPAPHWSVTPDSEVSVRARPGSQWLIKTHLLLMLMC